MHFTIPSFFLFNSCISRLIYMRNFLPVKCYYAKDISCVPCFFANGKKKLTINEADAKKLKIFLVIKKMLQIINGVLGLQLCLTCVIYRMITSIITSNRVCVQMAFRGLRFPASEIDQSCIKYRTYDMIGRTENCSYVNFI